ncbi:hypothetical protein DSO57_1036638 [Entomophthora muscae]|uniref:Uncharacterized protein n=1 Tax=Entomophthora muscae TaxID=34485 RepID=A0ACC2REB1_9FUNG|nr:hypothetical protein DSO57_1036638 [Entomophthora muscae]
MPPLAPRGSSRRAQRGPGARWLLAPLTFPEAKAFREVRGGAGHRSSRLNGV